MFKVPATGGCRRRADRLRDPHLTGDPFLIPTDVIHDAVNIGAVTTMMLSTYVVQHGKPLVINL